MATRGPYAKGTLKRQEILRVALEAVAQHGYRRTYISEIAQRVGLTQAGLIHHFRTREQLYEEIIRTRDEHDRDTFANAPHGLEGFFAVIEHNQHVPGLVQLYAEFSAEASTPAIPRTPSSASATPTCARRWCATSNWPGSTASSVMESIPRPRPSC